MLGSEPRMNRAEPRIANNCMFCRADRLGSVQNLNRGETRIAKTNINRQAARIGGEPKLATTSIAKLIGAGANRGLQKPILIAKPIGPVPLEGHFFELEAGLTPRSQALRRLQLLVRRLSGHFPN